MPRFYFDHQDGTEIIPDDEGLEFASGEEARKEALTALGGIARDVLPRALGREIAIEVLDENRRPLFRVALWSKLEELA